MGRQAAFRHAYPNRLINEVKSTRESLEARSEDLERALFELARERETVAKLNEALEESWTALTKPFAISRRGKSDRTTDFDAGALQLGGFSPDDIEWIRGRWEQAEMEKRYLAELEARDEDPPPGGEYSDIERELREDLGDNGYDAMLYTRPTRIIASRWSDLARNIWPRSKVVKSHLMNHAEETNQRRRDH